MGNKKQPGAGKTTFAGRMTEALIDALSAQGYHLIIEGTLHAQSEERTSFYQ